MYERPHKSPSIYLLNIIKSAFIFPNWQRLQWLWITIIWRLPAGQAWVYANVTASSQPAEPFILHASMAEDKPRQGRSSSTTWSLIFPLIGHVNNNLHTHMSGARRVVVPVYLYSSYLACLDADLSTYEQQDSNHGLLYSQYMKAE